VCMTAWVRDVPIEELLERAAHMCDETEAIPKKVFVRAITRRDSIVD